MWGRDGGEVLTRAVPAPAPSSSVHLPKGRYLSILLPKRTPSTPATTPLISPPSMNTARMQTANSPGRGPNGGRGSSSGGEGGGGGRKSNANHLLNFSLPTRAERAPVPRRSRKGGGGEGARWQVFNKESESTTSQAGEIGAQAVLPAGQVRAHHSLGLCLLVLQSL